MKVETASLLKEKVYLDNNATTFLHPRLREMVPLWLEHSGNPSSIHWGGRGPKNLIREARQNVAHMIGSDILEVVFTASGSESNNTILKGVYFQQMKAPKPRRHYLIGAVEHPSVLVTSKFLESLGAEIDYIPVTPEGSIDLDVFKSKLRPDTALVSCMLANNETGSIFPIKKMAALAHDVGALFHTDAVQALGKIPVNVKDLGVDFASLAGHKFYSLRGVGVLYQKRGTSFESLIHGGGQERHRRAGTENTLAIASLGFMAGEIKNLQSYYENMKSLRDHFESQVLERIPNVSITGSLSPRLPNTSSLVIEGVEGETLLMNLDMEGFAISTGAACSSGNPEPSSTLMAMGLTRRQAQSSLRVSLGWQTRREEIEAFILCLEDVVQRLRSFQNTGNYGEGEYA